MKQMRPSDERLREVFDTLEPYIERRYGVPVVLRALTLTGDLEEAARNLFTSLRELDAGDVPLILAAPPGGNEGLALAIADRLRRASH